MEQLTCKICGGTEFEKQDDVFVCQGCGCKTSFEEENEEQSKDITEKTALEMPDNEKNKELFKKKIKIIAISSAFIICALVAFLLVFSLVIVPNDRYNDAVESMKAGKYIEAIEKFEKLEGYKDSEGKIKDCNEAILENEYNDAIALMENGKYDEAIAVFEKLNGYNDSEDKIKECKETILENKYNDAVALMENGKYEEAIAIFEKLNGYKDSEDKIKKCNMKNLKIGESFYFGKYEQDTYDSNGKEDIEWIVLDKKNNALLIISKYALDCIEYDYGWRETTWADCYIRDWLNNTFLRTAFSKEEKNKILNLPVQNSNNMAYYTYGGIDTTDRIFLLSIDEANRYFRSAQVRICYSTEYAKEKGASSNSFLAGAGDPNTNWWLRSPGGYQNCAACVDSEGYVNLFGFFSDYVRCGVRPAMWIDIE